MVVCGIRPSFPGLSHSAGQITHVLLTRSPLEYPPPKMAGLSVRLACVKHAASVRPEPGSNSPTTTHTNKCVCRAQKQNKNKINSVSSVYLFDKSNTPPPPQGRGVRHPHNTTTSSVGVCSTWYAIEFSHNKKEVLSALLKVSLNFLCWFKG